MGAHRDEEDARDASETKTANEAPLEVPLLLHDVVSVGCRVNLWSAVSSFPSSREIASHLMSHVLPRRFPLSPFCAKSRRFR